MNWEQLTAMQRVLMDVETERLRQHEKWGEQNHPDGTGWPLSEDSARRARAECDQAAKAGKLTYRHIADEEIAEAYAESDPLKLRAELIQTAAVFVAWAETIDRRLKEAENVSES